MAKLEFDKAGQHFYETGVSHGILFPKNTSGGYAAGVAWNGLTAVTESPSGAEATALYADDIKYLNLYSAEDFGLTIEAYQSPVEFDECDGTIQSNGVRISQQPRKGFGFSYETKVGNDEVGDSYGRKIHLVYNCMASPSERSRETINDSPNAIMLSWEVTTTPQEFEYGSETYKPTAHIEIDTTKFDATTEGGAGKAAMDELEAALYGTDPVGATEGTDPRLPSIEEVLEMFEDVEAE